MSSTSKRLINPVVFRVKHNLHGLALDSAYVQRYKEGSVPIFVVCSGYSGHVYSTHDSDQLLLKKESYTLQRLKGNVLFLDNKGYTFTQAYLDSTTNSASTTEQRYNVVASAMSSTFEDRFKQHKLQVERPTLDVEIYQAVLSQLKSQGCALNPNQLIAVGISYGGCFVRNISSISALAPKKAIYIAPRINLDRSTPSLVPAYYLIGPNDELAYLNMPFTKELYFQMAHKESSIATPEQHILADRTVECFQNLFRYFGAVSMKTNSMEQFVASLLTIEREGTQPYAVHVFPKLDHFNIIGRGINYIKNLSLD